MKNKETFEKGVLIDNNGEMLAIGFTKEEQELIDKYPKIFKAWIKQYESEDKDLDNDK